MGEFLGALAGGGMLLLIVALVLCFLREIGALKKDTALRLGRCCGITVCMGSAYLLLGALISRVIYHAPESPAFIDEYFRGAYLQSMFSALKQPSWFRPVSGLFAWAGHGLGAVLFGNAVLGGQALCWGLTCLGVFLLESRLCPLVGQHGADSAAIFILSLPGALFLFLPGWPCVAFLGAACAFFFFGKYLPLRKRQLPPALYSIGLAVGSMLSAAVTAGAVFGSVG